MPKVCEVPNDFTVRPAGAVPVNFSLDLDALKILHQVAPTPKTRGRFLSRLLFEFAARQEERARLSGQPSVGVGMRELGGNADG